jgi:hypothetical protein
MAEIATGFELFDNAPVKHPESLEHEGLPGAKLAHKSK